MLGPGTATGVAAAAATAAAAVSAACARGCSAEERSAAVLVDEFVML
jgi:hypothetical protein